MQAFFRSENPSIGRKEVAGERRAFAGLVPVFRTGRYSLLVLPLPSSVGNMLCALLVWRRYDSVDPVAPSSPTCRRCLDVNGVNQTLNATANAFHGISGQPIKT
jgi:hypothetical protein